MVFGKGLQFKSLANLMSKDWMLKIISLILAVGLWYFVGGEDKVDKNVMVPIEIINLPRDLVISNQFKKEIEVTVSGPRSIILEMINQAVTRQVDLSSASPGTMVIENDNDHIPVPRGITVQRVQPSSIILSLDKLIQKQFPVSARTVGRVAEGYVLKSLRIDPDVITITGPQSELSLVDELFTKAINLSDLKESSQLQIPLELEPSIVDLIGETSVTADLTIALETVTKTVEKMKVHVVIDGIAREVEPEEVRITANIPKMLLEKDKKMSDLLSITAMRRYEEDTELQVKVIPKADVELPIEVLSIFPPSVELVIDEKTSSIAQQMTRGLGKINEPEKNQPENSVGEKDTGVSDSGKSQIVPHITKEKKKKKLEIQ